MANMAKQAMIQREVEVNRKDMIVALEKNREKHIETYHKALAGYKEAAAKKLKQDGEDARRRLEKNLQQVAADIAEFDPERPNKFGDHFVLIQQVVMTLPVPQNYSSFYDAAIDIARWDVNETLKLSYAEFNCFVRDQWDWTGEFRETTMSYLGR